MSRSLSFTVLLCSFFLATGVRAADAPICSTLIYKDEALLKTLPRTLRPTIETARFRAWVANRESAWTPLHQALDRALAHEGQTVSGKVDDLKVSFYFKRARTGELELWIDDLVKRTSRSKAQTLDGFQFLDLVAAELGWIAKARAQGKITSLAIIGKDVLNPRLADTLSGLGFQPSRFPGTRCYIMGLVGGGVGFMGGKIFFSRADADVENGSIYEEQRKFYRDVGAGAFLGAGGAVAFACFRKTGRNYSIEFDPREIRKNPEQRPPTDLPPPIDQKPPESTGPLAPAN